MATVDLRPLAAIAAKLQKLGFDFLPEELEVGPWSEPKFSNHWGDYGDMYVDWDGSVFTGSVTSSGYTAGRTARFVAAGLLTDEFGNCGVYYTIEGAIIERDEVEVQCVGWDVHRTSYKVFVRRFEAEKFRGATKRISLPLTGGKKQVIRSL